MDMLGVKDLFPWQGTALKCNLELPIIIKHFDTICLRESFSDVTDALDALEVGLSVHIARLHDGPAVIPHLWEGIWHRDELLNDGVLDISEGGCTGSQSDIRLPASSHQWRETFLEVGDALIVIPVHLVCSPFEGSAGDK